PSRADSGERARDHEALLPRPEREAPIQDERRLGRDPLEQDAVLARHREHGRGRTTVEQRDELEPALEPLEAPLRFEGDDEFELLAEALEILPRQVDAPVGKVLTHVAEDVADLQRYAEVVGEWCAALAVGAVEGAERKAADRARDAAAIGLELGEGRVRRPAHVHLGAV